MQILSKDYYIRMDIGARINVNFMQGMLV